MTDYTGLNKEDLQNILTELCPDIEMDGRWGIEKLIEIIKEKEGDIVVDSANTETQGDLLNDVVESAEAKLEEENNDDTIEATPAPTESPVDVVTLEGGVLVVPDPRTPEEPIDASDRIAMFQEVIDNKPVLGGKVYMNVDSEINMIELVGPKSNKVCINIGHDDDKAIIGAIRSFLSRIR
jgi:hypothetical protein